VKSKLIINRLLPDPGREHLPVQICHGTRRALQFLQSPDPGKPYPKL